MKWVCRAQLSSQEFLYRLCILYNLRDVSHSGIQHISVYLNLSIVVIACHDIVFIASNTVKRREAVILCVSLQLTGTHFVYYSLFFIRWFDLYFKINPVLDIFYFITIFLLDKVYEMDWYFLFSFTISDSYYFSYNFLS